MESKIIVTADNSKTLLIPQLDETYHSTNGALTEALHIFIKEGLEFANKKELTIFEMGLGTGLNALLALDYATKNNIKIDYTGLEAYPISLKNALSLDYEKLLDLKKYSQEFIKIHGSNHLKTIELSPNFKLTKIIEKLQNHQFKQNYYDVIFFDAFSPKIQADLWNSKTCIQLYSALNIGGFLVTYCAQGAFKRNLKAAGFAIDSIPGPPGKREMTRAFKQ